MVFCDALKLDIWISTIQDCAYIHILIYRFDQNKMLPLFHREKRNKIHFKSCHCSYNCAITVLRWYTAAAGGTGGHHHQLVTQTVTSWQVTAVYRYTIITVFMHFHSSMVLQPFVWPCPLLQVRNHFYTDGRTPWTGDQPVARPLPPTKEKANAE
jgi:hypothetical protein